MSKFLKFTFIILVLISVKVNAQTPKFGHINSSQLLQQMPETRSADTTIQKFGSSLEAQLKTMTAEYQNKVQDYKTKEQSMADPIKDAKLKEISDLEQRIQDFQESAQSSIQKKKEEIYSPIIKKAEDAIKGVAKEKSFSYVFDTSVGALLFAQDSDDIMSLVKAKLGLK